MKTKQVKNFEIVPPKNHSGEYKTPDDCPRGHMVNLCIGKRNSGKTCSITTMIEKMKYDYCIVISPTMSSNRELMQRINVKHVFENPDDPTVIDQVKEIIENEAKSLERYEEDMRRYNKMMKALNNDERVHDEDLVKFFNDRDFQKPTHEWNGRKPFIMLLVDDCLNTKLFTGKKLQNLSILSRHVGQLSKGGSIGVSLAFLCQSFKCQNGGLNKSIRGQATNMIIFKTKDESELSDIASSVGGEVDSETFKKVYNHAIGDGNNHEFLFIDLHKKPNHPSMFRKYFSEYIIPD